MANLKDWKDGEKLTGIDYTYERDTVTTKVMEVDTSTNQKGSPLFVLSETKPVDPYINIVWLDPNEFNIIASLSSNINTEMSLQGYATPVDVVDADITLNIETTFEGFKISGIVSFDIPVFIEANVNLAGYKEKLYDADLTGEINTNLVLDGYKQKIHTEAYNEASIQTNLVLEGYKYKIVKESLLSLIQTSFEISGYKDKIIKENLSETITVNTTFEGYKYKIANMVISDVINTNINLQGYKKKIEDLYLTGSVDVNMLVDGYKDSLVNTIINDHIFSQVNLQGYKVKEQDLELVGSIDATITSEGYKVAFEDVTLTGSIGATVNAQGYKIESEEVDLTGSIDTTITSEGKKVLEVYATSNFVFSGDSLFSVNNNPFPVTVGPNLNLMTTMDFNQYLTFDAPRQIVEGSKKYQLDNVYFTLGGDSSVSYPVQISQLSFQFFPTSRVNIYFYYKEVQIIPVLVKLTDLTVGSQFSTFVNLELLDENDNVVDSASPTVDNSYTQYFSFEDSGGYQLKISPNASHTSGSYRQFTINRLYVYYYNIPTATYELMYADSVSPIVLTEDPYTDSLYTSSYEKAIYVDAQYTSVQGQPPASNWVYSGSSNLNNFDPPADETFSTTVFSSCSDIGAVDDNLTSARPPSNYSVGHRIAVSVAFQNGGNLCDPRWMLFTAQ